MALKQIKMTREVVITLRHSACVFLMATTLFSAGCATPGADVAPQVYTPEQAIKDADAELAKGQRDKAIAILNRSSKDNPTSATPWLKISNIWFDAADYPASIGAANEALQRDPDNQEAKSLLVVGGLRIAANAVAGLRTQNSVNHTARQEAENLTSALRTALGEKNLVPTENKAAAVPHKKTFTGKTAGASSTSHRASGGAVDPFKSLK